MLFSGKCADPDEKSYYACGNSSRLSLFAKVPLLGESTKGKLATDCKSGRKLRHTQHVSSCSKFVLTLCMLSNAFFCPEHFLNLTDLSPSGPARRFAEPDLGLNCLYDYSLKCFQKYTINVLYADSFFRILFCHHNQITATLSQHPITSHYRPASETPVAWFLI